MHHDSYIIMKNFVEKCLDKNKTLNILDFGSYDVNGTYKGLFINPGWTYTGIDMAKGPNVDIVSKSEYDLGLDSDIYDVVISGNTLEHVKQPWLSVQELHRVTKKGGLICCVTPVTIPYHAFPIDCWRIMKDGYIWLFTENVKCKIIECSNGPNDQYIIAKKI